MKTRIENETVKPAGITYPALFKDTRLGTVWLARAERDNILLVEPSNGWVEGVGCADDCNLINLTQYTYIPGPLTITFNSDKE